MNSGIFRSIATYRSNFYLAFVGVLLEVLVPHDDLVPHAALRYDHDWHSPAYFDNHVPMKTCYREGNCWSCRVVACQLLCALLECFCFETVGAVLVVLTCPLFAEHFPLCTFVNPAQVLGPSVLEWVGSYGGHHLQHFAVSYPDAVRCALLGPSYRAARTVFPFGWIPRRCQNGQSWLSSLRPCNLVLHRWGWSWGFHPRLVSVILL